LKEKADFSTDYEKLMQLDEQESELKIQLEDLLEEWEQAANHIS